MSDQCLVAHYGSDWKSLFVAVGGNQDKINFNVIVCNWNRDVNFVYIFTHLICKSIVKPALHGKC